MSIFIVIGLAGAAKCQSRDTVGYVLGHFSPASQPDFVHIPVGIASGDGMYLRKEALQAFVLMRKAAAEDGVALTIVSATRDFEAQKRIWEAKWNGWRKVGGRNLRISIPDPGLRAREILRYSSMPGTSRHHWGTDMDLNSVNPSYFGSGKGKIEYGWLRDHASGFGFCQPYSAKGKERPFGYEEEKWHWSYVPIASVLCRFFLKHVRSQDLSGFDGADALPFQDVTRYVRGISTDCQ